MSHWSNKYVIGLTGNIAVGKSVVRQMTQHLGAYPIDADGLSHQAMAPGAPAYKPIVQTFGQLILDSENRINRTILGDIVFANPAALKKLEDIVHPVVRQAITALVTRAKQPIIIIEAIKLLEGDLASMVDEIWVVNAKPETQYKRLLEKRKMAPDAIKKRMLSQGSQGEKLQRADVIINNDGNIEDTWKQVQIAWNNASRKLAERTAASTTPSMTTSATATQTAATTSATGTPAKPVEKTQAAPTPATPPAQPAPAPIPVAASDDDEVEGTELDIDTSGVEIKRGMPGNAQAIADFITKHSGKKSERMDVMMAFGQKSYMIAQPANGETIIGLMGWQVENLITRVDEFYMSEDADKRVVIHALIKAVEVASKELQSEVGFIFLPHNIASDTVSAFVENGYSTTTVKDIKIPAWREALQEVDAGSNQILHKPLRKDRVLKPI